jgi:5-methylcytosine-specific restriction endonuclease McrA
VTTQKTKSCSQCGKEKPVSEFTKDLNQRSGLRPECRECAKKSQERGHKANPGRRSQWGKNYRQRNPGKNVAGATKWRRNNPEEYKRREVAYRAKNRARLNKSKLEWAQANRTKTRASGRRYFEANKIKIKIKAKVWRATHKPALAAKGRAWRKANPSKLNTYNARRRARITQAFVEHVDRKTVYDRDLGICYLCGQPVSFDKMHLDHDVPISRGGPHNYENTHATHATCNHQKSDLTAAEYFAKLKEMAAIT